MLSESDESPTPVKKIYRATMNSIPIRSQLIRSEYPITIALDLSRPIEPQIEELLLAKLIGKPSGWGVMMSKSLISLRVGEYFETISKGKYQCATRVPIRVVYEAKGYRIGDVLPAIEVLRPTGDESKYIKYLSAIYPSDYISLQVKDEIPVSTMNIIITNKMDTETMCYYAKPAIYPHRTTIKAELSTPGDDEPSFYHPTTVFDRKRWDGLGVVPRLFIDPLTNLAQANRMNAIMVDIKHAANILPTEKVVCVNEGSMNKDQHTPPPHDTSDAGHSMRFIPLDLLPSNGVSASDGLVYLRPPSMPSYSENVVEVRLMNKRPGHTITRDGMLRFKSIVREYIDMHGVLLDGIQSILPVNLLTTDVPSLAKSTSVHKPLIDAYMNAASSIIAEYRGRSA